MGGVMKCMKHFEGSWWICLKWKNIDTVSQNIKSGYKNETVNVQPLISA